jgi:hypothetical protein
MFIDIVTLYYDIDKNTLENLIQEILVFNCHVSVFGYNKLQNVYWCKKHIYSKIELSIEIEIISRGITRSSINFVFLTGTHNQIITFMNEFAERLDFGL